MTEPKDRRQKLIGQSPPVLNGIDYALIANASRTEIRVYFLTLKPLAGNTSASITGGQSIPSVSVTSVVASSDAAGRPLLTITVAAPGDSSTYTLSVTDAALDPFFRQTKLSFVAGQASPLDCETQAAVAQGPQTNVPPIDYLSKDFLSFRKALSDFSTLRYPAWQERSEADFGVMFMEALSGLGDDLSYQQDRVAAEAYLQTATERLSVVRHARLVGYEPAPALASSVLLQFSVRPAVTAVPPGLAVRATGPDGTVIAFETGTSLADTEQYLRDPGPYLAANPQYTTDFQWNTICPYWWDDSTVVLPAGATEMWVVSHGLGLTPGLGLVLDTTPPPSLAEPNIREIVTVSAAVEETDQLYDNAAVTHIVFQSPLTLQHDLRLTAVRGNLIPATQGLRRAETFGIGSAPSGLALAIARTGANRTLKYLYTLGASPLTWLATTDGSTPPWAPEILLTQQGSATPWTWYNSILDAPEFASGFCIDPVKYSLLPAELADGASQYDYDGSSGDTLRFGDGTFGAVPDPGSVFTVTYRAGAGTSGNVAADSITSFDPNGTLGALITAVTNPFAATGGDDPESLDSVRRLAPYAFQSDRYNAVVAADFVTTARSLAWVGQAGCTFRHTGSWLTAFTAAEPAATEVPTEQQTLALIALLERSHMVGFRSYVLPPGYASLDLRIAVTAEPSAYNTNVADAVLLALGTATFADGSTGFFAPGQFTFGQKLERSALQAAIQNVNGVAGVTSISIRRSGASGPYTEMTEQVQVAVNQIIRVNNDPKQPDAGSILVTVTGGK